MTSDILKSFITELLDRMGMVVERLDMTEGVRTTVIITSSDPVHLIGPQGEHLKALTTIAKRMMETKYGADAGNFIIDVNDYYEKQLEQVRVNARMLAQRARLFKYDVEMSPMSSYERLVIHELFAEDPEIETHSEGIGKFRHIVLKYRQGEHRSSTAQ